MGSAASGTLASRDLARTRVEIRNYRVRSLGYKPRKHRVEEAQILAKERLRKGGASPREILKMLEEEFNAATLNHPLFVKAWESLQPMSSTYPRREIEQPLVEVAAIMRLEEMVWLDELLCSHENSGRKPSRLAAMTFLSMALEGGTKFSDARKLFLHSEPLRSWAYRHPQYVDRSTSYSNLHAALNRRPPDVLQHIQIAVIRKLASLIDPRGGLKVGEVLVVDGTQQQAHVRQVFPVNEEHAEFLNGPYEDLAWVKHVRQDGSELKRNHGYNIVTITDMATSLPIISCPYPANKDERVAAQELLAVIFRLWPDCPAEYLVGDSWYDHSIQFALDLEFLWGLHPVFSLHGNRAERDTEFPSEDGVPKCEHTDSGFMKRMQDDNFFAGLSRVEKGVPRGEEPPNRDAFIRYACPAKVCGNHNLYVRADPRRHTYLPIHGDHKKHYLRAAMLPRRNVVESNFGVLKMLGYFGPGRDRHIWAKTYREACWAFMTPILGLALRRLVHETGLYDEVYEEADRLRYLTMASREHPAPGPTASELAAAEAATLIIPSAPPTWAQLGPTQDL